MQLLPTYENRWFIICQVATSISNSAFYRITSASVIIAGRQRSTSEKVICKPGMSDRKLFAVSHQRRAWGGKQRTIVPRKFRTVGNLSKNISVWKLLSKNSKFVSESRTFWGNLGTKLKMLRTLSENCNCLSEFCKKNAQRLLKNCNLLPCSVFILFLFTTPLSPAA